MKLGEALVAGTDSLHFNRPTDVAVAPDGSFYVSDGYRNSRVVKFSATGKYLFSWGVKGDAPGQFEIPHSLDLDDKGNVYVAGRENSRIQIFDPDGKFIREWKDRSFGKLYTIRFDATKKYLVCTDYITNYITPKGSDILVYRPDGKLISRFGRSGDYNGPICRYHCLITDKDGNIYVGDILSDRLQKFHPVAGSVR
jgi:peptidylamidoglycolate lyase